MSVAVMKVNMNDLRRQPG